MWATLPLLAVSLEHIQARARMWLLFCSAKVITSIYALTVSDLGGRLRLLLIRATDAPLLALLAVTKITVRAVAPEAATILDTHAVHKVARVPAIITWMGRRRRCVFVRMLTTIFHLPRIRVLLLPLRLPDA